MAILLPEMWLGAGRAAAAMAVSQLWQGVAVAAGLAVCLRLAPRTRASHRFALWMAAFVLVAALPLAPWLAGLFAAKGSAAIVVESAAPVAARAWFQLDERWGLAVLVAWALLAGFRLAMLATGAARARRIWKNAVPLANAAAGLGGGRLWGRAAVEICQSSELDRPSVIGFFRPRILVPDWLVGKLSEGELRQIVLHELEHLRRMDDWTNLFLKLTSALLALDPVLVWMDRKLELEREMATDEAVVRRTRAPRAYAACLASVAERRMQMKLGQRVAFELAAWRRRPELAERILSLLRTRETIGPVGRTTLAGTLAMGLTAAAVLLAHAPQLVAFQAAERPVVSVAAEPARAVAPIPPASASNVKAQVRRRVTRQTEESGPEFALSEEPVQTDSVVPVMAELQPAAAEAGSGGWVVLAVFEQHVTVGGPGAVEADFVRGEEQQKAAAPVRHRAKAPVQRQLILKLLPVREGWVAMEL